MTIVNECSTNRWELAQRLAGQANTPKEALTLVFDGMIKSIEEMRGIELDDAVKNRAWNKVSESRLQILRDTLLTAVCQKILSRFTDPVIASMLDEHKTSGSISEHKDDLRSAYRESQEAISSAVCVKAGSMAEALVPEVFEALEL